MSTFRFIELTFLFSMKMQFELSEAANPKRVAA
jgi:hypothetical protein